MQKTPVAGHSVAAIVFAIISLVVLKIPLLSFALAFISLITVLNGRKIFADQPDLRGGTLAGLAAVLSVIALAINALPFLTFLVLSLV